MAPAAQVFKSIVQLSTFIVVGYFIFLSVVYFCASSAPALTVNFSIACVDESFFDNLISVGNDLLQSLKKKNQTDIQFWSFCSVWLPGSEKFMML